MEKDELISAIKDILERIGYTTTSDLQSDYSHVYMEVNKHHNFLVEGLSIQGPKVTEYIHEQEADTFRGEWNKLEDWQLKDIADQLLNYENQLKEEE